MSITSILPLDILLEICLAIEDYPDYYSFIRTCKKIYSLNQEVRKHQTRLDITVNNLDIHPNDNGIDSRFECMRFKGVSNGYMYHYIGNNRSQEGYYRHNIPKGEWLDYFIFKDENGNQIIQTKRTYVDGKLHGRYEEWDTNDNNDIVKILDCKFRQGNITGVCEHIHSNDIEEDNIPNLFKYDNGVCMSVCREKGKNEIYQKLKGLVSNIDFDYISPHNPEFIYDFYFEYNSNSWLIDFDEIDESIGVRFKDCRLGEIKTKTIIAIENGYKVIRIACNRQQAIGLADKYIRRALKLGESFYSNYEGMYEFFWHDASPSINLALSSNHNSIFTNDDDENHISRLDNDWYRNNLIERDITYEDLYPRLKAIVDRHIEYAREIREIINIRERLMREMAKKKAITRFGYPQFVNSDTSLIYHCLFHHGGINNRYLYDEVLISSMSLTLFREIHELRELLLKCDHSSECDCEATNNQAGLISDFIGRILYGDYDDWTYYSCDDQWKLKDWIGLSNDDLLVLGKFAQKYMNILNKYNFQFNIKVGIYSHLEESLKAFIDSTKKVIHLLHGFTM